MVAGLCVPTSANSKATTVIRAIGLNHDTQSSSRTDKNPMSRQALATILVVISSLTDPVNAVRRHAESEGKQAKVIVGARTFFATCRFDCSA